MTLRVLVVVLGTAVCAALQCGRAGPQATDLGTSSETSFTLTIRARKPGYKTGTPIWIDIVVKNVSNREVEGLFALPAEGSDTGETAAELGYSAEVRDEIGRAHV